MTYKSTMVYVVMRRARDESPDGVGTMSEVPVAIFLDEETASGNAEGYNLEFEELGIEGIRFYVAVTMLYE